MRRLRRLAHKRSLRWSEGVCILEGPDLVDAALDAGREFEGLYVDEAALETYGDLSSRAERAGVRVFVLEGGVIDKIADAVTPQPVLAAVRFTGLSLSELDVTGLVIVGSSLRDPGNVGTIIRTADAAGASAVVLADSSVDPYNPKALRASAGSIFHIPVALAGDLAEVAAWAAKGSMRRIGTSLRAERTMDDVDLLGDVCVVFGSESAGLSPLDLDLCDDVMRIDMAGRAESLNVAVSVGVVAFESLRRRRATSNEPSTMEGQ